MVLDLLREDRTRYPHVDVKFDTTQPAMSPILLHLRPHIDLLFSPRAQRLHTISIRRLRHLPTSSSPANLTLRYFPHGRAESPMHRAESPGGGSHESLILCSPTTILRRSGVNKVFGPTYQGDTLSFPGIWFAFDEDGGSPLPYSHLHHPSSPRLGAPSTTPPSGKGSVDRNAEVKRVAICQRVKEAYDALGEVMECSIMDGEVRTVIAEVWGPRFAPPLPTSTDASM